MHLSFIGMSGVGKSHWAKQLAQQGFIHLDCDARIAQRLGKLIEMQPGEDAVHAVGRWMGMPWSPGYAEREAQYLDLESTVTMDALDQLEKLDAQTDVVLDTTGSVIYLAEDVLARLRDLSRVVYFEAPHAVQDEMAALYKREPKPLVWQGAFHTEKGETQNDALARCYRALLAQRSSAYTTLANITMDYHTLRQPETDVHRLKALADG